MPQLTQVQLEAAGPFVDLIASKLGRGREVQSETAIACSARVAGNLLLRSFNFDISELRPGSVILSEEANEKGPALVSIVEMIVARFGLKIDPASAGGKGCGHEAELSFLETMDLLQEEAIRISERFGLTFEEAAQAAAVATGFIVKECAKSIDVDIGFNAAVYGFIEGSKTVPPRLSARA
jgi:hypothetical protein